MKTDIEIARECSMQPIGAIADKIGIGDEAFSAETADSTLLQVRSGAYLLTASSRSQGGLEPVGVDQLRFLAAEGLAQLP